ncbi:MAG: hypothetical protein LBD51_07125 [Bifidobacteriaceae bacterium]|jgi:Tfp pilus assembly protein PilX|nr:hypothetical protein [Bifidobacteriaceae bacterium]
MRGYLRRKRRQRAGEEGITLVAVLVSFTIVLAMILGSLALISNSTKHSRHQQDTELALAAAESGLNALLSRLRGDPSHVSGVTDKDAEYCKAAATGGPTGGEDEDFFAATCGWDASTGVSWEDVSGGSQLFHYSITDYDSVTNSIEVLSTGVSNNVYRTVKGYLGRQASEMWLYISDYELADPNDYSTYLTWTADPAAGSIYGSNQITSQGCGGGYGLLGEAETELGYKWQIGDPNLKVSRYYSMNGFDYPCEEPGFIAGDILDGPVHSNDTIKASGADFTSSFSTSDPACDGINPDDDNTWDACVNGTGNEFTVMPTYRAEGYTLPGTKQPKEEVAKNDDWCKYEGPTRIVLEGSQMRVWSPYTTATTLAGRSHCGNATEFAKGNSVKVDIPKDGLVYVDAIPAGAFPKVDHEKLASGAIGGLPLGTYEPSKHSKPNVLYKTYTYEKAMEAKSMWARNGNLFIEGSFSESLTVAADSVVVITGDLVAAEPTEDLLGIIAKRSIQVYNPVIVSYYQTQAPFHTPVWSTPSSGELDEWMTKTGDGHSRLDGDPSTLTIHAAMYAETGGFGVQNYKFNEDLGTLYVYGSIAQRFRGVVGYYDDKTSSFYGGYHKQYRYNETLAKASPLLFSPIQNGTWVISWLEKAERPAEVVKKS